MIKSSGFSEILDTLNQLGEAVASLDGIVIEANSKEELIHKLENAFDEATSPWKSNKAVQDTISGLKEDFINQYIQDNLKE